MSEVKGSTGVSTRMFVVGLILAILISSTGTYTALSLAGFQGPKGDKGDSGLQGITGNQGLRGLQGEKGDPGKDGGVTADIKGLITDTYSDNFWTTDTHIVDGFVINFGTEPAYNVVVKITWNLGSGQYVYKYISLGTMWAHHVREIYQSYRFNGKGTVSYAITWD